MFPKVRRESGLYRFQFLAPKESAVYIGESVDLAKRFYLYANPGPSQATNQRINEHVRSTLDRGGAVIVDACTDVRYRVRRKLTRVDLKQQSARRFAENAAILAAEEAGDHLLNR